MKGITTKICRLYFFLINSVLLNILCVWILTPGCTNTAICEWHQAVQILQSENDIKLFTYCKLQMTSSCSHTASCKWNQAVHILWSVNDMSYSHTASCKWHQAVQILQVACSLITSPVLGQISKQRILSIGPSNASHNARRKRETWKLTLMSAPERSGELHSANAIYTFRISYFTITSRMSHLGSY